MAKRKSASRRVREMVEQGFTTQEIVAKCKVRPQVVYNIRYQINKAKGLRAGGKKKPNAGTGIVAHAKPVAPKAPIQASLWRRFVDFLMGK